VTQKKWKTQEEFSKMVIENIPLGVAVFQKDFQPVLQNSYLSEQIKLNSEALLSLVKNYDQTQSADYFYKDARNENRIVNIDRTNYFDSEIDESLSVYLVKDVTEVRQLELQKKQSEKMAAVGQLAAGIAHEIRNPLAGISGSIQLLSQDTQDETEKKLMKIIMKEIDRLNSLITEFLDYAKPEKIPDTKINAKEILDEVLLVCKRHPEVPADLAWNVQLQDGFILGFHEKLKQAFLNIVINGIQAMKDRPGAKYSISLAVAGDFVVLKLQDSGIGMSEETKRKMFEPFHTTKVKGTGLGLAITHKILENHKAVVVVNTEVNVGTEFVIKFPAVKG
ncbi:MAG: two-component system sensor histidine kinase NtrB, partial [Pseudobdellovibrio sp.]